MRNKLDLRAVVAVCWNKASSGLAAEHATAPQSSGTSATALYLPREVFFGRLVFAGAFVPVCASDFGRFFPDTSRSFQLICSR